MSSPGPGERAPPGTGLRKFLARPEFCRRRPSREALRRYDAALTHRSFAREQEPSPGVPRTGEEDYERLEFLGDRVLNLVVAGYLYSHHPEPEGLLTARMEVVKNRHLGSIVPSLGIGFEQMIRRGRSQPLTPRIIAGAFEAFIGALYLDAGFDRTREIVLALVGGEIEAFSPDRNYKKILQETVQKQYRILPVYRCVEREGSDHLPLFTYEVLVDGKRVGLGSGASIALATQDAACDGLKNLGRLPGTL